MMLNSFNFLWFEYIFCVQIYDVMEDTHTHTRLPYIYIYIYIYTHTHTQTHTLALLSNTLIITLSLNIGIIDTRKAILISYRKMVKSASIDKNGIRKGSWSIEEDEKLRVYIQKYGHWNWRQLPKFAGK